MPDVVTQSGIILPAGWDRPLGGVGSWGHQTPADVDIKSSRIGGGTSQGGAGVVEARNAESKFRDFQSYLLAIKLPWVNIAVTTIAYTFAKTTWDLVDDSDVDPNGDAAIVGEAGADFRALMARPNPVHKNGFTFLELAQVYYELVGNVYISLEERDGDGIPREIYLPNPARMIVVPAPDGSIKGYAFDTTGMNYAGLKPEERYIPFDPDEIVHIKGPNPLNEFYGLGTVEASEELLNIAAEMGNTELNYWRSGGRIIGVLQTEETLTDKEFENVRDRWQASNRDRRNRVRTAILEKGLKYTPIAEGMRNLDLVNISKDKRDTILAMWGVPKSKAGIMEDANYKATEADQFFHQETMQPKSDRWEEGIAPLVELFNPDWRWQFERKTYEDDTQKIVNANAMGASGRYTVNETRVYEGNEPLPGDAGDVLLIPSGYIPVKIADLSKLADQTVEPPPAPAPPPGAAVAGPGGAIDAGPAANPSDPAADGTGPQDAVKVALADHVPGMKAAGMSDDEIGEALAAIILADQRDRDRKAVTQRAGRHADARRAQRRAERARSGGMKSLGAAWDTKRIGSPEHRPDPPARVSPRHPVVAASIQRDFSMLSAKVVPEAAAAYAVAARDVQRQLIKTPLLSRVMKLRGEGSTPQAAANNAKAQRRRALREGLDFGELRSALTAQFAKVTPQGYAKAQQLLPPAKAAVGLEGKATGYTPDGLSAFPRIGSKINRDWQSISDTMVEGIASAVDQGLARGYTPLQVAVGVPDEAYSGLDAVFGSSAIDWRTEMIARTEMMTAYNGGAFQRYEEVGVTQAEAIDGTEYDEVCMERDGMVYPLVDGDPGIEDHPNGQLTWMPVIESIDQPLISADDLGDSGEG